MSERKASFSLMCVGIARAILHDRATRRKLLARMLMVALGLLAAGLWWVDGWLHANVLRFALWWLGCGLVTFFVVLFALYDALAVIREERDKMDLD